MIRRWTHVHSLATGLVFGLVLDKEALVIFALGIGLGIALVLSWRFLRGFSRAAKSAAGEAKLVADLAAEKTRAEIARKLAAADEARSRAEGRRQTIAEQDERERRAYWAGARDGDAGRTDRPKTILGIDVAEAMGETS
jgi:hypothetical protein